jgi:hypothetical protein
MTLPEIGCTFLKSTNALSQTQWLALINTAVPSVKILARPTYEQHLKEEGLYRRDKEPEQEEIRKFIVTHYEFDAVEIGAIVAAYRARK